MTKMTKTLTALAAVGAAAVAAPQPAQARGGALAAGAIISSAAHGPYYVTAPDRSITAAGLATGLTGDSGTAGAGACSAYVFATKRAGAMQK